MLGVLVINPNSNAEVTHGIDAAMAPLRTADGPPIDVVGLEGTPHGVTDQHDVEAVTLPVTERIGRERDRYDAFVIACFSDPGLFAAREASGRPVFGIAQAGLLTAAALGERIGVISMLDGSIPRHRRYYRSLGLDGLVAGDLAVGAGVAELAAGGLVAAMAETGRRLRDDHGADVLVLGCAGMAGYRPGLEAGLGLPVIEPTQAAVGLAVTVARLGLPAA